MLVEFRVQNHLSFNSEQTISLLASTSTKENYNEKNTFSINRLGVDSLLKSAVFFGANASGKTNLSKSFTVLKNIIFNSLIHLNSSALKEVLPFLVKENKFDIPTEFEVTFICKKNLYRYGISIVNGVIDEEWLYWRKTSRETILFHRYQQEIEINQRSFSEAKDFIVKKNNKYYVDKTREDVPFISVLASYNSEKSRKILNWFQRFQIISGLEESQFKEFTIELFEKDHNFKKWAIKILKSLQIEDIIIVEEEKQIVANTITTKNVGNTVNRVNDNFIEKKIQILKNSSDGNQYILPFSWESDGTKKLIYLLGPLYDSIKNSHVLFVDEFDSKFHSILTRFLIKIFHENNNTNSQLLITCQDTNLLSKDILRRDQIWFVDKNSLNHESELYSLLEYKEHYTRKGDSYSKDYLNGKYGAIPLFSSIEEIEDQYNG